MIDRRMFLETMGELRPSLQRAAAHGCISWLSHFGDVCPKKQGDELTRCRAGGNFRIAQFTGRNGSSIGRKSSSSDFSLRGESRKVPNFCHREPTHSKSWSGQLSIRFGGLSIPIYGYGAIILSMAAKSKHHF